MKCKHENCPKEKIYAKGYCSYHYRQIITQGYTQDFGSKFPKCKWKDCKNHATASGGSQCVEHRNMCVINDGINWCGKKTINVDGTRHSVCPMHKNRYKIYKEYGSVGLKDRKLNHDRHGKWLVDKRGYIYRNQTEAVTGKTSQVFQHRLVAEDGIGRKLLPGENVHHINGDRADNRWPENLEIWNISQPPGQRAHEKIKFYTEFLRQYGFTVELADPEALGIDPNLLN